MTRKTEIPSSSNGKSIFLLVSMTRHLPNTKYIQQDSGKDVVWTNYYWLILQLYNQMRF